MKKGLFGFNVHDIVEIAMFVAIALVLDNFLKIPLGASGGSINLAVLPLVLLALRHGWFKGFVAGGIIFGFISCLIDAYGLVTYPLEYFVTFGSVAIVGAFSKLITTLYTNKKYVLSALILIGCLLAFSVIRLFAASIDSVLIYEYTFEAAIIYNLSYVFISSGAVCVLSVALLPALIRINKQFPTSFLKNNHK